MSTNPNLKNKILLQKVRDLIIQLEQKPSSINSFGTHTEGEEEHVSLGFYTTKKTECEINSTLNKKQKTVSIEIYDDKNIEVFIFCPERSDKNKNYYHYSKDYFDLIKQLHDGLKMISTDKEKVDRIKLPRI